MKNTPTFIPVLLSFLFLLFGFFSCREASEEQEAQAVVTRYAEPHRPQFHFSPDSMWMNDPNGMVFYKGEYHLFYQYYPDSTVWGPMHWGHAVSSDLVHWEHLPIALYPDSLGYIFSGSAVVDEGNTSGFQSGDETPLVAFFTYHDPEGPKAGRYDHESQAVAYSLDRGRTWTKYEGNPVIPNPGIRDFRDPKVFRHEPTNQWVMIFAALDRVRLYTSPNLKDWSLAGEFGQDQGSHGGVWECPDLFELPVEGSDQSRWVLLLSINPGGPNGGSGTQYFIGNFDGKTFTNENPRETVLWIDYGPDNYAGVTWSDVPDEDGRRIFLGWMSNWQYGQRTPTERWRSAMTVPRALTLKQTDEGIRLFSQPVQEMEKLRGLSFEIQPATLDGEMDLTGNLNFSPTLSEISLTFEIPQETTPDAGVELSNGKGERVLIGYDASKNEYYIDRRNSGKIDFEEGFAARQTAPRAAKGNMISMRLLIDVSSVEFFADDGQTLMTAIFFPNEDYNRLKLFSRDGEVSVKNGVVYELKSIWK
jgi:fructan beta-fructosidase